MSQHIGRFAVSSCLWLASSLSFAVAPPPLPLDSELTMEIQRAHTPLSTFQIIQNLEKQRLQMQAPAVASAGVTPEQIVNLGLKVWQVIEKNRPVSNIRYHYANALPKGIESSSELTHFSNLAYESYRMRLKNFFGYTVVDLIYTLVHQYGGRYQGKGSYLETVSVIPSLVSVAWGYRLNYGFELTGKPLNVGSKSWPIASLATDVHIHVSTVMKSLDETITYQFRGDSAGVFSTEDYLNLPPGDSRIPRE